MAMHSWGFAIKLVLSIELLKNTQLNYMLYILRIWPFVWLLLDVNILSPGFTWRVILIHLHNCIISQLKWKLYLKSFFVKDKDLLSSAVNTMAIHGARLSATMYKQKKIIQYHHMMTYWHENRCVILALCEESLPVPSHTYTMSILPEFWVLWPITVTAHQ